MVPFEDLVAVTRALVELLEKVLVCHRTLGPKTTEMATAFPLEMSLTVKSRTLLEFIMGSKTVRSVALAAYTESSMSDGNLGEYVTVPANIVP
jgi:hypothetical protein